MFRKVYLDPDRFKGIKAIALGAYLANKTVSVYAHTNSCRNATQLGIGPSFRSRQ